MIGAARREGGRGKYLGLIDCQVLVFYALGRINYYQRTESKKFRVADDFIDKQIQKNYNSVIKSNTQSQ